MDNIKLNTIEEGIEEIKEGKLLIVVDDEDEYSKDSKQKESKDQSSDKNDARFDENDAKKLAQLNTTQTYRD